MTYHPIATSILLGLAVLIALICAVGLMVMRDPLQRLHFSAPIVSLSAMFIAAAVWLENFDPQARIKSVLIAVVLFVMNSILTHATAKAVRIRDVGHWDVRRAEGIPLAGTHEPAGGEGPAHDHTA